MNLQSKKLFPTPSSIFKEVPSYLCWSALLELLKCRFWINLIPNELFLPGVIKYSLNTGAHFRKIPKWVIQMSLVPSCARAVWTLRTSKMNWPSKSDFTEIDGLADVLICCSVWVWMGASGCGRPVGKSGEMWRCLPNTCALFWTEQRPLLWF